MFRPRNIPTKPGIYKMIDEKGDILYIGKAKDLKKRVSSYFRKSAKHGPRIKKMVEQVKKVEALVVGSEEEALLLENNLIKENRPKYNILLRDDKNFVYIKITAEDYPRIELVRQRMKDGAFYIGPKTSSGLVKDSLDLLRKVYPFRTCNMCIKYTAGKVELKKIDRKTPCLDHHIERCNAPCISNVSPSDYQKMFDGIKDFFKGKFEEIAKKLEEKMYKMSEMKKFEQAGQLRDLLKKIQWMREKQIIVGPNDYSNMDIVGLARDKDKTLIKLLVFREGKMVGEETMFLDSPRDHEDKEVLEKFLFQYYSNVEDRPKEVILPEKTDINIGAKSIVPKGGRKKDLLNLAKKNAEVSLDREKARFEQEEVEVFDDTVLKALQKILNLNNVPKRIECYDISHLGGTNTYASMVVFENGKALTDDYRRFKIITLKPGQVDDYGAIREAVSRRLRKLGLMVQQVEPKKKGKKKSDEKEEENKVDSFSKEPDLIVIDGGKGQLSVAIEAMKETGINVEIISIAKKEEEIFTPGKSESIKLDTSNDALRLIQRLRDEAHRFAITANQGARDRSAKESALDKVPGIGQSTKRKLLKTFGSVSGIKKAEDKELIELIGTQKALVIKEYL